MGASNQEEIYAEQWNLSAKYFYEKNRYHWMANKLEGYDTVLEIGCGMNILMRQSRLSSLD